MYNTMKQALEEGEIKAIKGTSIIRVKCGDGSVEFGIFHSCDYNKGNLGFLIRAGVVRDVSWTNVSDFEIIPPMNVVNLLNAFHSLHI